MTATARNIRELVKELSPEERADVKKMSADIISAEQDRRNQAAIKRNQMLHTLRTGKRLVFGSDQIPTWKLQLSQIQLPE